MSTNTRVLYIVGAILALAGSFLPWQRAGDPVSYWTYGISIYPTMKDNGGLLIVILTLIVIMLIFRPPDFLQKPLIWGVLLSILLVFDSAFHIGKFFINRAIAIGHTGAPAMQIGLVMVSIGSILLLVSTAISYFRSP